MKARRANDVVAARAEWRKSYHSNKASIRNYQAQRYAAEPEKWKKYNREWMQHRRTSDLGFRIRCNIASRMARAVRLGQKAGRTIELLGCSIPALLLHLKGLFQDGMTFENFGRWEIDHRIPCAAFDLSDPEEQKKCFHFSNLQPLWKSANRSKGASLAIVAVLLLISLTTGKAAFSEFYCQTTGSNLNAGSTTADAAVYTSPANGGWNSGTGVFTPVSGNPSATVSVGDFASVYLDAAVATGFVGRVTAVNTTTITVSITSKSGTIPTTAGTGLTCKTGGAWKGPNAAEAFPFAFITNALTDSSTHRPRVNMKGGTTYSITAALTHANSMIRFEGYTSAVGDGGRATIDGSTNAIALLTVSGGGCSLAHLILSNNGTTGTNAGLTLSSAPILVTDIVVHNIRGAGINATTNGIVLEECEAYLCNTSNTASSGGFTTSVVATYFNCISHDNAGANNNGFYNSGWAAYINCIADTNGLHGWLVAATNSTMTNCDAYNNGGDGLRGATSSQPINARNCNFIKNGGWGVNSSVTDQIGSIRNCGFGSGTQANTSGTVTAPANNEILELGSVTYASGVTPWVDPANGDFRINLATAKGTGRGTFTQTQASYAGTIGYSDIGAAQHLETAATSAWFSIP